MYQKVAPRKWIRDLLSLVAEIKPMSPLNNVSPITPTTAIDSKVGTEAYSWRVANVNRRRSSGNNLREDSERSEISIDSKVNSSDSNTAAKRNKPRCVVNNL